MNTGARPKYVPYTLKFWMYAWNFKLTPRGRKLVAAGLLGGMLGAASLDVPIYPLFLCLFFLGLFSLLANLGHRPRLKVSIALPERAVAGQPFEAEATLENTGRFSAFDVCAGFLHLPLAFQETGCDNYIACLPPGTRARLNLRLLPRRRGVYTMPPLRAFSAFPFHLLRSGSARHASGALMVQPAFSPLAEVRVPVSRRYQPGGIALTSNIGESPEYIGNREFRPGDPIKHIDFRSWARLTRPAVREFQEEYYCRLALVLDTHISARAMRGLAGYPEFEAGIAMAAAVADALSRGEYLIDLFAAGTEVYVFRAGRHIAHLENILEILACVEPCRKNPFPAVTPRIAGELSNISALIGIFGDWDESRADLMRMAEEAGCHAKAIIVRNAPPSSPLETGGIADIQHFTANEVRMGGVDSV